MLRFRIVMFLLFCIIITWGCASKMATKTTHDTDVSVDTSTVTKGEAEPRDTVPTVRAEKAPAPSAAKEVSPIKSPDTPAKPLDTAAKPSKSSEEFSVLREMTLGGKTHASKEKKSGPLSGRPSPAAAPAAAPLPSVPAASGLKAGFSDDNKQFNYFLSFLKKYESQVDHYPIAVDERILIRVRDKNNRSIANAVVRVYSGDAILCTGRTYADGTFLFFPSEHEGKISRYRAVIEAQQEKKEIIIDRQGMREIVVSMDGSRYVPQNIPFDLLFILDTTGSMGEEINRLKNTIEIINLNLASLSLKPDIRFGMVLFKDRGDEYVTRIVPLTNDIEQFRTELNKVTASGGGDNPEDLQSALLDSLSKIKWNPNGIRLAYIITDAPPHLDYGQTYTYVNAVHDGRAAGIKIYSVGTGGLNIMGEYILRQIAQYTYAKSLLSQR